MEKDKDNLTPEQPEEGYAPRPARQIWAARVGVVIAILMVIAQVIQIAFGGL